jgi:hypothetical protein
VTAAVVVGMVTVGMQQAYAPRDCPSCVEFKKMTNEFEKAVMGSVGNPNDVPPNPVIRGLLQAYAEDVNRIFLGGPDIIPELVGDYQQEVLSLLVAPPDPEKHPGIAFMQDFRKLTYDFEKAVINAVTGPEN